eukprot:COSAG02_NODE_1301_length_13367_cov_14.080570_15_plen_66_part_00
MQDQVFQHRLSTKFGLAISWRFVDDLHRVFAGLSAVPWILSQSQSHGGEVTTTGVRERQRIGMPT